MYFKLIVYEDESMNTVKEVFSLADPQGVIDYIIKNYETSKDPEVCMICGSITNVHDEIVHKEYTDVVRTTVSDVAQVNQEQ